MDSYLRGRNLVAGQPACQLEAEGQEIVVDEVIRPAVIKGLDQLPGNPGLIRDQQPALHGVAKIPVGLPELGRKEIAPELVAEGRQLALDLSLEELRAVHVQPFGEISELLQKAGVVFLGIPLDRRSRDLPMEEGG